MVTVAQAAIMLAITVTLAVISSPDLTAPPTPPGGIETAQANGATFGSAFRLAGWDASADGSAITLRLDWQGLQQMTRPYWFSALLVAPDGTPAPQAEVWQPLQTRYPTTCWRPGEQVGEEVTLRLPPDAQPGDWWISLFSFDDPTASERLPVILPDGSSDTQVGLGPVHVP
jgi:hypothetical protein